MIVLRYSSTREAAIADVGRATAMATGGALAFAPVEYALTLWAYAGPVDHQLRLAALVATLALVLWFVLAVAAVAIVLAARGLGAAFDRERARGPGLFQA